MKVVLFSRVPGWYSFRSDRLVNRLVREGHEVVGIVVQRVRTLESIREWLFKLGPEVFLKKCFQKSLQMFGRNRRKKTAETAKVDESMPAVSPPVHVVDSHNSQACIDIVRGLSPEVLILRGCGIIKKPILDIPKLGTINPHYAILPLYRGMDVTEWAALHGDPVAVSVHFVSEGVDTGAILASRFISVEPGDTTGQLRDKSAQLAVDLFVEVLSRMEVGTLAPKTQHLSEGRQYFVMHPRLRLLVNERLRRA